MNTLYLHHVQPSSLPPKFSFGVSIHSKTLSKKKKKKKIDQGSSTQEAEAGETFLGSITTWFTQ